MLVLFHSWEPVMESWTIKPKTDLQMNHVSFEQDDWKAEPTVNGLYKMNPDLKTKF